MENWIYIVFLTSLAEIKAFLKQPELYMTQPAVSQAIANLEKELEIHTYSIEHQRVTVLTNEGKLLHEYVNSALGIIRGRRRKSIRI